MSTDESPSSRKQQLPTSSTSDAADVDAKRAKTEHDESPKLSSIDEDGVRAEKQLVRKEIRVKLKALSSDEIHEQSKKVWDKLVDLPVYKSAKSVGLFLSMPKSEISTEVILRHCVAGGKDIYVPQVGQNFENAHMELLKVIHSSNDTTGSNKEEKNNPDTSTASTPLFYESWPKNKWKIPEPPSSMPIEMAQPGDVDLLVVPGLAFDRLGNRLGQGKGYYDRFIERMSVNKPLKLVAVCLDCQLLESGRKIPVNHYDQQMQMILSPSETFSFVKDTTA
eukprot:CAMPEP_0198142712 /NCGR_PEP_ID=MMETSP1443-20131203/5432_1 /TAXON_ID=186043 /ORGANISM="Entomoneis sp., Strain CCMP2396" /LENGTH=278 /DNA_ID=CAMNT_0043805789 /DNA_START=153 /DNA_END=989 /DNA_ORIENTATION=-